MTLCPRAGVRATERTHARRRSRPPVRPARRSPPSRIPPWRRCRTTAVRRRPKNPTQAPPLAVLCDGQPADQGGAHQRIAWDMPAGCFRYVALRQRHGAERIVAQDTRRLADLTEDEDGIRLSSGRRAGEGTIAAPASHPCIRLTQFPRHAIVPPKKKIATGRRWRTKADNGETTCTTGASGSSSSCFY